VPLVVTTPGWHASASTSAPPRVGTSEDISNIFLTSGSTGVSKGAMVSHRAAWLRAIEHDVESGATGRRGYVVMFGLFHMSGWSSIETSWSCDRPVHLATRAEPHELLGVVERHGASTLYCIPAVWQRIIEETPHGDGGHDTSGLVEALTGTSLVTLDLIDAIKARFPGSWTSIAYGSTEIGRGATLLDPDLHSHPGSVGQPPPMVTADLSDDGELWLRGPTMVSGYLDRPHATAEAIDDDGWFHTGDLATRDADGYFTITGRRSESIRSGGEWVAPVEVETAIRTHPAVHEVAVVGLPDDRWGELVCAAIVVRPGATLPSVDELREHVGATLIRAKQPRVVVQVDVLPRTDATGQVRRRRLRDQLIADLRS
jgi:acyl-CoA synthetase (AMP-forming)/AMP-acid ligase II